jgi:hypothetical protein
LPVDLTQCRGPRASQHKENQFPQEPPTYKANHSHVYSPEKAFHLHGSLQAAETTVDGSSSSRGTSRTPQGCPSCPSASPPGSPALLTHLAFLPCVVHTCAVEWGYFRWGPLTCPFQVQSWWPINGPLTVTGHLPILREACAMFGLLPCSGLSSQPTIHNLQPRHIQKVITLHRDSMNSTSVVQE